MDDWRTDKKFTRDPSEEFLSFWDEKGTRNYGTVAAYYEPKKCYGHALSKTKIVCNFSFESFNRSWINELIETFTSLFENLFYSFPPLKKIIAKENRIKRERNLINEIIIDLK